MLLLLRCGLVLGLLRMKRRPRREDIAVVVVGALDLFVDDGDGDG